MNQKLIILFIVVVISFGYCRSETRQNSIHKREDENHKLFAAIFRRLATLEAKQHNKASLEERVTFLEKHLLNNHPVTNNNAPSDGKKKVKLNDTYDLEDRVHILELGLAAVADDLDELEESQVTKPQGSNLLIIR